MIKDNYAHAWDDPAALGKDTEKVLQRHYVRKYFLFVFCFVFNRFTLLINGTYTGEGYTCYAKAK